MLSPSLCCYVLLIIGTARSALTFNAEAPEPIDESKHVASAKGADRLPFSELHDPQVPLYDRINIYGAQRSLFSAHPRKLAAKLTNDQLIAKRHRAEDTLHKLHAAFGPSGTVVNAAAKHSRDGHIIITGGDWQYRSLLLNWIMSLELLGIREYVVICYDRKLYELIGPWDYVSANESKQNSDKTASCKAGAVGHAILAEEFNTRDSRYKTISKIVAISQLLSAGYIVTWSDSDAVWLRDGLIEEWILPFNGTLDMLGQMGKWPMELHKEHGATLCTGLFSTYPSESVRKFFPVMLLSYLEEVDGTGGAYVDDQVVINNALARIGNAFPVRHQIKEVSRFRVHFGLMNTPFIPKIRGNDSSSIKSSDIPTVEELEKRYYSLALRDLDAIREQAEGTDFRRLVTISEAYTTAATGSNSPNNDDNRKNKTHTQMILGLLPYGFFPRGAARDPLQAHWDKALLLGYEPFYWHIAPFYACARNATLNKLGTLMMRGLYFPAIEWEQLTTFDEWTEFLRRDLALYDYCSRGLSSGGAGVAAAGGLRCGDPLEVEIAKGKIARREKLDSLSLSFSSTSTNTADTTSSTADVVVERGASVQSRFRWMARTMHPKLPMVAVREPVIQDARNQIVKCPGREFVDLAVNATLHPKIRPGGGNRGLHMKQANLPK